MTLERFHAWLQYELPEHTAQIKSDLGRLHKLLPKMYEDLPKPEDVLAALTELQRAGVVKLADDGRWYWLMKVESRNHETQGALFT